MRRGIEEDESDNKKTSQAATKDDYQLLPAAAGPLRDAQEEVDKHAENISNTKFFHARPPARSAKQATGPDYSAGARTPATAGPPQPPGALTWSRCRQHGIADSVLCRDGQRT